LYSQLATENLRFSVARIKPSDSECIGIVLVAIDGEFLIKTFGKHKLGAPRLLAASKDFKPIEITKEMQFEIWGVVTGSFRRFR
jgi:DNA polymerase V